MRARRRSRPTTPASARSSTTARPGCSSAAATRRESPRPSGNWPGVPSGAARWASAGGRRRSPSGAGRACSTAWTAPTRRRSRPAGEGAVVSDAPRRRLLLVAYFYPPCRDTGVLRGAAMAKWLRRLGHEVTVLTTSAYGALDDDALADVVRTADAQRWRARLAGKGTIGAMFDSPTYSGRPHPLSKVFVPEALVAAWAPFARSRALRLQRERRFDCVITSSPPESAHAVGMALHRRGVPWVADIRDAWTFESLRPEFPTAAQRALDRAPRAPLARRRRRRRLRLRARPPPTCAIAGSPRRCSFPTAGTPRWCLRPPLRPVCSTPSAPRSSTPGASAATGATRGRWSRPSAGWRPPTPRRPRSSSS